MFEAMTSPSVVSAKQTAVGAVQVAVVEHSRQGGVVSLHTCRQVRLDLHGCFRQAASGHYLIHARDEWDQPTSRTTRTGVWEVVAEGVPLVAGGTLHLTSVADNESRLEIIGDVMRSSPFASERLATCFGLELERSMRAEAAYVDGLLTSSWTIG